MHRARCNVCRENITQGVRWKCANCLDYDLCEKCEAQPHGHPPTHLFLKIKVPLPHYGYHPVLPDLYEAVPPSDGQGACYGCENCRTRICLYSADVGQCKRCKGFTSSGAFPFCRPCSLELQVCHTCGGQIAQMPLATLDEKIAEMNARIAQNSSSILVGALEEERDRYLAMKENNKEKKTRFQLLQEALDLEKPDAVPEEKAARPARRGWFRRWFMGDA